MPRRATRRASRRENILHAALECFTNRGFSATTIEDIRARSGASTGSLYHHFADKEELAGVLYLDILRGYQASLLRELGRCRSAERGIKTFVRHYLSWIEEHPASARYLLDMSRAESVVVVEHQIAALNRRFHTEVGAWLKPHLKAGRIRRLPAEVYAAILTGPSREFARHFLSGRTKPSLRTARKTLADVAWNALRAE